MNAEISAFVRSRLKDGLALMPDGWQRTFKLMYGRRPDHRGTATRDVADAEAMAVNDVVDEMPDDKLDNALSQVQRSLEKLNKATTVSP